MRDSGRAVAICATIIETARQCNLDKVGASPAPALLPSDSQQHRYHKLQGAQHLGGTALIQSAWTQLQHKTQTVSPCLPPSGPAMSPCRT